MGNTIDIRKVAGDRLIGDGEMDPWINDYEDDRYISPDTYIFVFLFTSWLL